MQTKIDVLDHGFVKLIDGMGSDKSIVDDARVSVSGLDVKATSTDRNLIRYLLRHKHTTPFEGVVFKFSVKVPIFIARQWMRHRMGTFNEVSARYSVLPEEYYVPKEDRMQVQAKDNHQGSGSELVESPNDLITSIDLLSKRSFENYRSLLDCGLSRELSRSVLPVNTYTQFHWKVDLWNLMHFLRLRLDGHAQYEIRVYGEAIYQLIKERAPLALEAFEDYILNSMTLTSLEIKAIAAKKTDVSNLSTVNELTVLYGFSKREVEEFKNKLIVLGLYS